MKKILTLMLALVLVFGAAGLADAASGKVTYEGDAEEFIFAPGSDYSPTDLFPDFKDVMPGDTITQKITVKNDASKDVKVKIYLRAKGAHKESAEFLSKLGLTVEKAGGDGDYMFDAAASKKAQLKDWVLLGTLYSGGKVSLNVTLEVPVDLGNEFADQAGYLDWQFKVEEFPADDEDSMEEESAGENQNPNAPKTGDDSRLLMWIALMAGAAAAFFVLAKNRKKQDDN
ncbi:MAG: LPXTG cell wall anchor domain-containing protein [Firmicutes bacterium]|nr:LPXTG cell wall anchor domain-containing protein [Bacillota bacterium]